MSVRVQALYERGKFFIETGTANSFKRWLEQTNNMILVPEELILRIEHFISVGDTDSAVNLWLRVCKITDNAKWKISWSIASMLLHILVAGMALYGFFYAVNH